MDTPRGTIWINYHGPDPSASTWGASWQDDATGESIGEIDYVRRDEAIEWARGQTARRVLITNPDPDGGWISPDELDDRVRTTRMNEHDEQPGEGWTMGARDDYTRKALEAVEAGSTDTAVVYMMIGLSKTLQSLEHQITAINLREGRNDYPPEAEPYFDKAQQFAQAGELEKALVYGVLNVGALLDGFFPRMDEMIHALRSRR